MHLRLGMGRCIARDALRLTRQTTITHYHRSCIRLSTAIAIARTPRIARRPCPAIETLDTRKA
jgi:hypothetical protein